MGRSPAPEQGGVFVLPKSLVPAYDGRRMHPSHAGPSDMSLGRLISHMMPALPIAAAHSQTRYDRFSSELRAYLRDEWGSEGAWPIRPEQRRAVSPWVRLRRWFRARPRRQGSPSPVRVDKDWPTAVEPARLASADGCLHLVSEDLGVGGSASFLRCTMCGEVLVVQGGREWWLQAATPEPPHLPGIQVPGEALPATSEEMREC